MATKRTRLNRTQISLSDEELRLVRRLARQRRTSMSGVIRNAIRREGQADVDEEQALTTIIAMGEGDGRSDSSNPDEAIYG